MQLILATTDIAPRFLRKVQNLRRALCPKLFPLVTAFNLNSYCLFYSSNGRVSEKVRVLIPGPRLGEGPPLVLFGRVTPARDHAQLLPLGDLGGLGVHLHLQEERERLPVCAVHVDHLNQHEISPAVSRRALVRWPPAAGQGKDVVVGTLGEVELSVLDCQRVLVNGDRLQRSEGAADVAYLEAQLVLLLLQEPQRVSLAKLPPGLLLEVDRLVSRCAHTEGETEKRTVLKGGAVNLSMVRSVQLRTADSSRETWRLVLGLRRAGHGGGGGGGRGSRWRHATCVAAPRASDRVKSWSFYISYRGFYAVCRRRFVVALGPHPQAL
jgi:hypothetical protein